MLGSHSVARRAAIAFAFGLFHGFGFAIALRDTLQFAGEHLVSALVAFNLGVEFAQLAALAVFMPILSLLLGPSRARMPSIILSAIIAHTAWHWLLERGEMLQKLGWPALDKFTPMTLGVVLAALAIIAAACAAVKSRRADRSDRAN